MAPLLECRMRVTPAITDSRFILQGVESGELVQLVGILRKFAIDVEMSMHGEYLPRRFAKESQSDVFTRTHAITHFLALGHLCRYLRRPPGLMLKSGPRLRARTGR